jgi:hypothetical protein
MARTLAGRYRTLLLAYPRRYRRDRGPEIVGTFLELAPPERSRPTAREAANLIGNGLRCRLGRPASRSVVAWAVLTTVVCALFAAAAGSWIGWQTARPLPSRAAATRLFAQAVGSPAAGAEVEVSPAMFVFYGAPLRWHDVPELLAPDGAEYQQGAADLEFRTPAGETLPDLRDRLTARRWQVSATSFPTGVEDEAHFTARRGDDVLLFQAFPGSGPATLSVQLVRSTPWAVYPVAAAGGLLGAAAAFWLFGWASRRTDGRGRPLRATTTFLYAFTMLLWWLPIAVSVRWPPVEPHPMWEFLGQPQGSGLFAVGAAAALRALGLAALPRRDRRRSPGLSTAA